MLYVVHQHVTPASLLVYKTLWKLGRRDRVVSSLMQNEILELRMLTFRIVWQVKMETRRDESRVTIHQKEGRN